MSPRQIELVQRTWKGILPIADTVAALFYARLFELDPALRMLFNRDSRAQGRSLMQMIDVAVASLSHVDSVVPAVEALGRRHTDYGVKDEHYAIVGEALLWALGQGLGDAFTDDVREAWATTYHVLAQIMRAAARKSGRTTDIAA